LSSVTLGKAFAECFTGFAECFRHSAKQLIPVVVIKSSFSTKCSLAALSSLMVFLKVTRVYSTICFFIFAFSTYRPLITFDVRPIALKVIDKAKQEVM
jgi:hypothetical protein